MQKVIYFTLLQGTYINKIFPIVNNNILRTIDIRRFKTNIYVFYRVKDIYVLQIFLILNFAYGLGVKLPNWRQSCIVVTPFKEF